MNWRLKILAKIFLSRLPVPYSVWKKLRLFQYGNMDRFPYASKIFQMHFKHFKVRQPGSGFTMLELGPGDSLSAALFGYVYGARRTYLVDVGNFVSQDMMLYSDMFDQIVGTQPETIARPDFRSLDTMLDSIGAVYLCDGVDSLKTIERGSVDFLFSHSVLEHIKLAELEELLAQLFRISKVGSIASHNIDYMDHLGGGQNHLRFSKDLWESEFLSTSGFYTNRIPAGLMHQNLKRYAYEPIQEQFGTWASSDLQLPLHKIHGDLRKTYQQFGSVPTSSIVVRRNQ